MHFKHDIIRYILADIFTSAAIVTQQGCYEIGDITSFATKITRELRALADIRETVGNLQHRRAMLYADYVSDRANLESMLEAARHPCKHSAVYANGICKVCGLDTHVEGVSGLNGGITVVEPEAPICGPVILNMTTMEIILGSILESMTALITGGDKRITPYDLAVLLVGGLNRLATIEQRLAEIKAKIAEQERAFSQAKDVAEADILVLQSECQHAAMEDGVCPVCGHTHPGDR